MRHETRDKRQATRDKRQETRDKQQETTDNRQERDKRETRDKQERDKREKRQGKERDKRERQERETRERDKRETRETKAKNKFTHIALVRSYPTICCDPYSHRENKTSQDTERTRQAKTTQDNTNKTHMCTHERQETRDMQQTVFWATSLFRPIQKKVAQKKVLSEMTSGPTTRVVAQQLVFQL